MTAINQLKTVFWLIVAVLLLSACGFQPRGESARPAASISPLFITGLPQHHPLVRELRQQLQINGVSLAAGQNQAATILRLGKPQRKRSVFSVNANNKAVEHEIRHSLRYSIEHPPGNKVLEHQPLTASYITYNPGGQLLGRTREAQQRSQDAYRELAQRLVYQLSKIR
ncbi:LPS-assembly lipoprotein LptE [Thiolapillus sp.]